MLLRLTRSTVTVGPVLLLTIAGCTDYPPPALPTCLVEGTCTDGQPVRPVDDGGTAADSGDMSDAERDAIVPSDEGVVQLDAEVADGEPADARSEDMALADMPVADMLLALDSEVTEDMLLSPDAEATEDMLLSPDAEATEDMLLSPDADAVEPDAQPEPDASPPTAEEVCRNDPDDLEACTTACEAGDIAACISSCRGGDPVDASIADACAAACLDEDWGDPVSCGRYIQQYCWITLAWADPPTVAADPNDDPIVRFVVSDDYFVRRYIQERGRLDAWPIEMEANRDQPVTECDASARAGQPLIEGAQRGAPRVAGQGFSMCAATRSDGSAAYVRFRGGVNNNDLIGVALICEGPGTLDVTVGSSCEVHVARADNFCGAFLEGHDDWYISPNAGRDGRCLDPGNYMVARTDGLPGQFALLPTPMWLDTASGVPWALKQPDPVPVPAPDPHPRNVAQFSRDDSMGVAWRCGRGGEEPEWLASRLERSANVVLSWSVGDSPAAPLPDDWPGPDDCEASIEDDHPTRRCASSSYDGLYHRFNLPFDELAPNGTACNVLPGFNACGFDPDSCTHVAFNPGAASPVCHGRPHDLGIALRGRPAFP